MDAILVASFAPFAWPLAVFVIALLYKKAIFTLFRALLEKSFSFELPGGFKISTKGADQQTAEASSVPTKLREFPDVRRTPAIEKLEQELLSRIAAVEEKDRVDVLALNLAAARLGAAFGEIYALIFGSQIFGLFELEKRSQVTNEEANAFFIEYAAKRFPLIYQNYGFSDWLRFLISYNLIEQNQSHITITDIGRDFLIWLRQTRLPTEKHG